MTMADDAVVLSEEDAKLVTLARGARGRVGAPRGAAVRDETGRTYAAADVSLPSLTLSALQLAVAQAVAAGARGAEAAVVVAQDPADDGGRRALADLGGADVAVHLCSPDGTVIATVVASP
jgi:cytidine deaminase